MRPIEPGLDRRGAVAQCVAKPYYLLRFCEHEVVRNDKCVAVPSLRAWIRTWTRATVLIKTVGVGKVKGRFWNGRVYLLTVSPRNLLDPSKNVANVHIHPHSFTDSKHKKAIERTALQGGLIANNANRSPLKSFCENPYTVSAGGVLGDEALHLVIEDGRVEFRHCEVCTMHETCWL